MEIKRDTYLNEIIQYKWDGQIKVITGIRRCGKSFLLRTLYKNYLLENSVAENQIIGIELDQVRDIKYRNPLELTSYVSGFLYLMSRTWSSSMPIIWFSATLFSSK